MFVTAIVAAAGKGLRLKSKTPKPFVKINGVPIIYHTLKALRKIKSIKEIILVTNKKDYPKFQNIISELGITKIVLGGKRRQDSVRNGLEYLDKDCDLVLVHDAVRPFIQKKIIEEAINTARRFGAAVVGVKLKPTVKCIDNNGCVANTLNRGRLFEIQTPQVFKKDLILQAYSKFGHLDVTDDASLVEKLGKKVKLVEGSYCNIKITTPEDLVFAEVILRVKKRLEPEFYEL